MTNGTREMHSIWGFYADTGHPLRTQHRLKRGAMALQIEAVKPSDLAQLAQRMSDAADKVWEVALDYDRQVRAVPVDADDAGDDE